MELKCIFLFMLWGCSLSQNDPNSKLLSNKDLTLNESHLNKSQLDIITVNLSNEAVLNIGNKNQIASYAELILKGIKDTIRIADFFVANLGAKPESVYYIDKTKVSINLISIKNFSIYIISEDGFSYNNLVIFFNKANKRLVFPKNKLLNTFGQFPNAKAMNGGYFSRIDTLDRTIETLFKIRQDIIYYTFNFSDNKLDSVLLPNLYLKLDVFEYSNQICNWGKFGKAPDSILNKKVFPY